MLFNQSFEEAPTTPRAAVIGMWAPRISRVSSTIRNESSSQEERVRTTFQAVSTKSLPFLSYRQRPVRHPKESRRLFTTEAQSKWSSSCRRLSLFMTLGTFMLLTPRWSKTLTRMRSYTNRLKKLREILIQTVRMMAQPKDIIQSWMCVSFPLTQACRC